MTCPNIATTQEEPLVTKLIARLVSGKSGSGFYPAMLDSLSDEDMRSLRNACFEDLHRVTGSNDSGTLYVDKLPLNIIEDGFIHRLSPAARFLVALRNPRDVCLSIPADSISGNLDQVEKDDGFGRASYGL